MKRAQIKVEYGQLHAYGGSLWGAVARNRFGSHLRILQTSGTGDPSALPFNYCQSIEVDYQSGTEQRRSKGSADLIYAHASIK